MTSYKIVGLVIMGIFIQIYFFDNNKSDKMPSNIKLHYFDNIGRGEQIRMILDYGKIPFEDIRLPRENWLDYKQDMPFGQVPVMDIDGKRISQTTALNRYFAKQANLAGKSDMENLEIDSTVDAVNDLYLKLIAYHFESDPASKKTLEEPLLKTIIPLYLTRFDNRIKENGGYLGLNRFTWADIVFVNVYESLINWIGKDITPEYPNIGVLKKNFVAIPAIKEHLLKRPKGPPVYDLKNEI